MSQGSDKIEINLVVKNEQAIEEPVSIEMSCILPYSLTGARLCYQIPDGLLNFHQLIHFNPVTPLRRLFTY